MTESSLPRRIFNGLVLTINILACIGLIVSAYCGYISPLRWGLAPAAVMTFPIWLISVALLLVLDLIWWRRTAIIVVLSMAICYPQIRDFTPINMPHFSAMKPEEKDRALTIMSYNTFCFGIQNNNDDITSNPQLNYVIEQEPDIVCIEEAARLAPTKKNKITQEQLARLNEIYPYIYLEGDAFAFMSKYEAEPIPISFPVAEFESGDIAGWRVRCKGEVINVFVVHLRSFALSVDERGLFKDLTTIDNMTKDGLKEDIKEARQDLLPKIVSASQERVRQIMLLEKYLSKYGGKNAIVCGDFNDPVCCWGLHKLEEDCRMKQVYTEVGFGPMITYNANHFFFRIDHILYRGDLKPYSMSRGKIKASDHYPVTATFLLPEK